MTIQRQATQMYAWTNPNRTPKYNPKIYLGTQESVGLSWLYNIEEDVSQPTNTAWPESFGEKNTTLHVLSAR